MSEPDTKEKLIQAYDRMMERIKHGLEEAEHKAAPKLRHAVDAAREKAVELGEVTREEAERLGEYIMRDLHDIGEYIHETGEEMETWFQIDKELIEVRLLDLISSVADKTSLELAELAARAKAASTYHTGEIAGPGTLECEQCGEQLHFKAAGHIPPCPKCHQTSFRRPRGK